MFDHAHLTRGAFALLLLFADAVCPPGKFDDGTACVNCGFANYCPGECFALPHSRAGRSEARVAARLLLLLAPAHHVHFARAACFKSYEGSSSCKE
jgi:hypothetical protein